MQHTIMRTLLTVISFFTFSFFSWGQIWKDQLNLEAKVVKTSDNTANVVIKAKITKDWHIFSVAHDPAKADFIGTPTTLVPEKNKQLKTEGKLTENKKPIEHKDEFGLSLIFENGVEFVQKVKILSDEASFYVPFTIEGQVCHDIQGCIPFEKEFNLTFEGFKAADAGATDGIQEPSVVVDSGSQEVEATKDTLTVQTEVTKPVPAQEEGKNDSWLYIFIAGFGGGLIALLTPCVFPMIPMTVSFFTKQSGSRRKAVMNAMMYGLSIIIIYVALGLLITRIYGSAGLNALSTNIWMNLIFFIIFMVFAFSFLGAFEIRMPSSWINKADQKADKGGMIGIFFMAFTLSLVSFSCTGPIIGTLLVESSQSSLMGPAIGMAGFSLALAIPFTLFAIFPGWLNSLPQSGGWLNSVKVVLGLLELALALKFLSGIDLAYHWGILTREIFIAVWIAIFFIMGFYLLGKIRFSHDSPVERLSVTRFMFALAALVFAVYLVPGMWGAPLKLIDGVAPPRTHSEDHFKFVRGDGAAAVLSNPVTAKYAADMHEVDGGIKVFHDLDKGRAYAKEIGKPILLDFTGYNCPNCRRTESTVWTNEAIRPMLLNDFVIISLYVDDKTKLPESEWKYSEVLEQKIKTVGNKWGDYQIRKYGQISQPLYVITDEEGNDLTKAIGYTPDIQKYAGFLKEGKNKYVKK